MEESPTEDKYELRALSTFHALASKKNVAMSWEVPIISLNFLAISSLLEVPSPAKAFSRSSIFGFLVKIESGVGERSAIECGGVVFLLLQLSVFWCKIKFAVWVLLPTRYQVPD